MVGYHVNPATGEPGLCRASSGHCPFGDAREHFATLQEAREAVEEQYSALAFRALTKKKTVRLYHGSQQKFEHFIYPAGVALNGADEGHGFYFTTSAAIASDYSLLGGQSGYVYEIDFHGRRAIARDRRELSDDDYRALLLQLPPTNAVFQKLASKGVPAHELLEEAVKLYSQMNNDADNVSRLITEAQKPKEIYEHLYSVHGFDHIVVEDSWGANELTHRSQDIYVVTVPEAITIKKLYGSDDFQAVVRSELLREKLTPAMPRKDARVEEVNYYLSRQSQAAELTVDYALSEMVPEDKLVTKLSTSADDPSLAEEGKTQLLEELHKLADEHSWTVSLKGAVAKELPRKLLTKLGYSKPLLGGWLRQPQERS